MAPKVPESLGDAWQELYTAALIELDKDKMKFSSKMRSVQSPSVT